MKLLRQRKNRLYLYNLHTWDDIKNIENSTSSVWRRRDTYYLSPLVYTTLEFKDIVSGGNVNKCFQYQIKEDPYLLDSDSSDVQELYDRTRLYFLKKDYIIYLDSKTIIEKIKTNSYKDSITGWFSFKSTGFFCPIFTPLDAEGPVKTHTSILKYIEDYGTLEMAKYPDIKTLKQNLDYYKNPF